MNTRNICEDDPDLAHMYDTDLGDGCWVATYWHKVAKRTLEFFHAC